MPIYETIFIVQPDYTDDQKADLLEKMKEILVKNGAEIKKREDWGVKKLAYRVAKQLRGHYYLICYDCKPDLVWELERNLKIAEGVIKYMSVKLKKDEIALLEKELRDKNIKDETVKRVDLAEAEEEEKPDEAAKADSGDGPESDSGEKVEPEVKADDEQPEKEDEAPQGE